MYLLQYFRALANAVPIELTSVLKAGEKWLSELTGFRRSSLDRFVL